MITFVALGCMLAIALVVCLAVDLRDRRHRAPGRDWSREATNSRLDIQTLHHHTMQGSTLFWATHKRADRARRTGSRAEL